MSIGCGNSRLLLELKNKKNCEVEGIDIEQSVVDGLGKNGIQARTEDVTKEGFGLDGEWFFAGSEKYSPFKGGILPQALGNLLFGKAD